MEFLMLGPLAARHDGAEVDLGDPQQRCALAVLLQHANRPISREKLTRILWGDKPPRSNLVPGYIAKIRKAFREAGADEGMLETTPTGYLLRVSDDQLDTARFVRLREEAGAARRAGDATTAAGLLRAALRLWRGGYLEDLDIDRIGGGEVLPLDEARLDAMGDLAELELAEGDHRSVRDLLWPEVYADPARQRLAVLLIRALLANEDRVRAMEVYHSTRDALDEHGMETTVELRTLARRAQYGEPRSTLQRRPPRFTGRVRELAEIIRLADGVADDGPPAVVWLNGMPGVGKTALATEAAHRLREQFPDAQLSVALNGYTPSVEPTPPADALAGLLADLGMPREQIPSETSAQVPLYQSRLAGTRTLVLLDNAASTEQVLPLLPDVPGCLVIVTSRQVGDLDGADNIPVAPMPAREAAELFGRLVGEARVHGRSEQVQEVVRRCGRLPLQIRVVASQFRRHHGWPLEHLVTLLADAGPWQPGTGFSDDGIVACMVSYQHLDPAQQTLFRLLGCVPSHDLDEHGAAALAEANLPAARALLDDLLGASLLEEPSPGRYRMLDPLKDFAATALTPAGPDETSAALDRLLDHYLASTAAAMTAAFPFGRQQLPTVHRTSPAPMTFPDSKPALAWLGAELPNLLAAIRYAAANDRPEHTWQLAVLLWRYLYTTGRIRDWMETLETARSTVMAHPGLPSLREGQAHVLLRLSSAYWRSGDLPLALDLATQALPRWRVIGDAAGEADALSAMAATATALGRLDEARPRFEDALAKFQEVGDTRGHGNVLSMLGNLNELHGEFDLAVARQTEAVRLLERIGHRQGVAHALDNLGSAQRRLGRFPEALANHERALALAVEIGDHGLEAYSINYIANVHRDTGDLDKALQHHELARRVADEVGDPNLRTQLYLDRATTYRNRGDHRNAQRNCQAALDLAEATGDRVQRAHASHGIARTSHTLGDHETAIPHWRSAAAEFADMGLPEAADVARELSTLDCPCATAVPPAQFQHD